MNDHAIRMAAFDWLSRQVDGRGDVLPWALLAWGFEFKGQRIPLLSQQGIFKPKALEVPISIRTSPKVRATMVSARTDCFSTAKALHHQE